MAACRSQRLDVTCRSLDVGALRRDVGVEGEASALLVAVDLRHPHFERFRGHVQLLA